MENGKRKEVFLRGPLVHQMLHSEAEQAQPGQDRAANCIETLLSTAQSIGCNMYVVATFSAPTLVTKRVVEGEHSYTRSRQ